MLYNLTYTFTIDIKIVDGFFLRMFKSSIRIPVYYIEVLLTRRIVLLKK